MVLENITQQLLALVDGGVQRFPKDDSLLCHSPGSIKTFFVICDHSQVLSPGVAEQQELVQRLLARLGILQQAFRCFAPPCEAGWGISQLKTWTTHVKTKLVAADPKVVMCFGHRCLQVLLLGEKETPSFAWEACEEFKDTQIMLQGKLRSVILLPSALELVHCPEWRSRVWQSVQKWRRA